MYLHRITNTSLDYKHNMINSKTHTLKQQYTILSISFGVSKVNRYNCFATSLHAATMVIRTIRFRVLISKGLPSDRISHSPECSRTRPCLYSIMYKNLTIDIRRYDILSSATRDLYGYDAYVEPTRSWNSLDTPR